MKLLFCPFCQDVLKLQAEKRTCICGKSWGRYVDCLNAEIGGYAIPLGIGNRGLANALESRPETGNGREFLAFVIPKECNSVADKGLGSIQNFRGDLALLKELLGKVF